MLSMIVAMDENRAIGVEGQLPWQLPDDLAWFRKQTLHHSVVMGRKTFDSLPFGPLKLRKNYVASRSTKTIPGCLTLSDLTHWQPPSDEAIVVIGGEAIYKHFLNQADRLLITHVHTPLPKADAFFPPVDLSHWHLSFSEFHGKDLRHLHDFTFAIYERPDALRHA